MKRNWVKSSKRMNLIIVQSGFAIEYKKLDRSLIVTVF